jgi:hypothetical protein
MTFQRKILRKIFVPVIEDIPRRIRTNIVLEKLYKDLNTGNLIKLQCRGWIGWMKQGTPRKYTKPTYGILIIKPTRCTCFSNLFLE